MSANETPKTARILIVDDEPNVRLVFRTTLESQGYATEAADDGLSALDAVARATPPFDLMLLDLRMPGLDGMETLARLRDAGLDLPVVMITAHGSIPDAVHAMKLGAIDFLSKPLSPEALRLTVAEVLARHAARESAPAPPTAADPFAAHLVAAKRALNHRDFGRAEVCLKQAIGLHDDSAEAHNLMGVLHELRHEHDASYREYKAALKADRHHEPAQNNMRRYYERFTFGRSDVPVDTGRD